MPITVYGSIISTCTQRVLATIMEKNLEYDFEAIDFEGEEHQMENSLADKNPFGLIPVMVDVDGFQLYASRAICRYLEMKYKGHGTELIPNDNPRHLGQFEQAASVEISYFDPFASGIIFEKVFKKMKGLGEADKNLVASFKTHLNDKLDVYEKILEKQPYLAGENFTLADLFHLPYGTQLFDIGEDHFFESRPHVKDWWERITSRPSWKAVRAL